jgi:signal transduction histidine kinase
VAGPGRGEGRQIRLQAYASRPMCPPLATVYCGPVRTEPSPPPARLRPPLTKRLRPGHWIALDYLAAGVLALVLGVTYLTGIVYRFAAGGWFPRLWVAGVLIALTAVPVAVRRRHTITALAVVLVASVVTAIITSASVPPAFLAVAFVLYMAAVTFPRKVSVAALAIVLGLLTAENLISQGVRIGSRDFIPVDLFVIIAWTIGYAVGQRRAYARRLQEQVASSAVAEERLRIARELHDVVAHSMTVVAVQAGFGQYVFDEQPAQARAALGAIQATSREALAEMQHLLGVLRQVAPATGGTPPAGGTTPAGAAAPATAGGGPPLRPAPGLADLDRLIARTADAGVRVELRRSGRRAEVPAGIDLSAYRIVQEALTNVVKHARATSCQVTICYGDDDLSVEVTDDGPAADGFPAAHGNGYGNGATGVSPGGMGHGILGMRERAHLYGGEFTAAPLPDHGFKVAARFPLPEGRP